MTSGPDPAPRPVGAAAGLDAAGLARFKAEQTQRIAELRAATADRPEHAEYLEVLIEQGSGVEPWTGVSRRVADALDHDVSWCVWDVPAGQGFPSGFPGRYHALRATNARAARRRAETIDDANMWGWTDLSGPGQEGTTTP